MTTIWIALFVALWLVVLVLIAALVGVGRRLRMLEQATSRVATPAPAVQVGSLLAASVPRDEFAREGEILLFVSSTCGACNRLTDALREIGGFQTPFDLGFTVITNAAATEDLGGTGATTLRSDLWSIVEELGIPGTPYAVAVSPDGRVLRTGFVTEPEGLLDMVEVLAPKARPESGQLLAHRPQEATLSGTRERTDALSEEDGVW